MNCVLCANKLGISYGPDLFVQLISRQVIRRLEGVPYPFRVDDFPGFGDVNDISSGLTAVAYDLSSIQVIARSILIVRRP
jgi:hypothetical protein